MKFKNNHELELHIHTLKLLHDKNFSLLKEQFELTYESMKPINIIKNTISEIANNQTIKRNAIDTMVVLSTKYVIDKISRNKPHNKLIGVLASFLEFSMIKYVTK
jgi:hypothetical protein